MHALFEVAFAALGRSSGPDNKRGIADALKSTKMDTIVGPVDFTTGPVPGVAKTPLVGGQWRRSGSGYDLVIVSNAEHPNIPTGGTVESLLTSR